METTNPYLYSLETMDDDYLDWTQQPFLSPLSVGCSSHQLLDNTLSINNDFLQYIHHPSDLPAHYYQHQQHSSPMEEDEDDDDDSLDCSISTPLQFSVPAFDQRKDNDQQKHSGSASNHSSFSSSSTLQSSESPSFSSISSSSSMNLPSTDWPSSFLDNYTLNISRNYVSLSDVNAFVAKADSIKHSTYSNWTDESPSSLYIDTFVSSAGSSQEGDSPEMKLPIHPLSYDSPLTDQEQFIYQSDDDEEEENESMVRPIRPTKKHKRRQNSKSFTMKKGRNVDKACNHCKHSHLRCDEMRPCRRCLCTGKSDCQDVQHKPRGRPKLYKK